MFRRLSLLTLPLFLCSQAVASEYSLPERVKVLPLAFVPKNEKTPSEDERKQFLRHIRWTQDRYRKLLGETFELADPKVEVIKGERPLDFYRKQPEGGAPDIVAELLAHYRLTRFNCPHVFCILLMNSKDNFPNGGGRSINGGFNTGGGMLYISSWQMTKRPNFQSTMQHELAHAFGLPHVDTYGYDMKTNASIMSYNQAHHTKRFEPSPTPGILIPEDRRGLSLNKRAFPQTIFDPQRDIPANYQIAKRIVVIGPMTIPGYPDFYPKITTSAGEDFNSKVINIVREEIKPNMGPGNTYDASCMWQSKPLPNGKALLEITFPFPVQLTGLSVHSQHSGQYNEATAMLLETNDGGVRRLVIQKPLQSVEETVTFSATRAAQWTITLSAGTSRAITVRGLRFYDGTEEICPHMVP